MIGEKEFEKQEDINAEETVEFSEDEKMRFRLQEADIELEHLEDILPENMTSEEHQKMIELKEEIKDLRKALKNIEKKDSSDSIWEEINIWYVMWGVLAFILIVYPLGPLFSAYYLTLLKPLLSAIASVVTNKTLQQIIVFCIYLIYFILYFVVDLVIYRFLKKNKTNRITMLVILGVHFVSALISVLLVIGSFF